MKTIRATINTKTWKVVGRTDPPGYSKIVGKVIGDGLFVGGRRCVDLLTREPVVFAFSFVDGEE